MAAKRRRRKHKRNPKHRRAHARRKRRANPTRRHHRRARRSNPRRYGRRRHARRAHANPRRRRRFHAKNPHRSRRRRRRNPEMATWMKVAIAAVLGVGVYALVTDGAYAGTQRIDPTLNTLTRNRWVLGLAGVGLGLFLAKKSPIYGGAIAIASAIGTGAGSLATNALGKLLDKAPAATTTTTTKGIGAYRSAMGRLGAVYGQNMQAVYGQNFGMGAVYGQNMQGYQRMGAYRPMGYPMLGMGSMGRMGDYVPGAPWASPTPF